MDGNLYVNNLLLQLQIISIIEDVDDMTLATIRADGFPQANTITFMNEGLSLFFLTGGESRKVRNIARNNKVSLTIDRPYKEWKEIESLSMGALAFRVTEVSEMEKIGELLLEKFPEAAKFQNDGDAGNLAYFRIEPTVISLLDYQKGFGYSELVDVQRRDSS